MQTKSSNKLNETALKNVADKLDKDTEIKDIDGVVADVLVVTDPEISKDEYEDVIERAQEIIEDTPEGDLPFDEDYLGEYVQTCPICGSSFIEDHLLEPRSNLSYLFGATRSICSCW